MQRRRDIDMRKQIMKTLLDPEVKQFEEIMSEKYKKQITLRDIPLKEVVDVNSSLLETKVATLIMEGAVDEAGYWRNIVNVHHMTAEKEEVPLTSMRDYKVRTGQFNGSEQEESGGKVQTISLDVSEETKERYLYVRIRERDIETKRFNFIADSLRNSGAAFAKHILDAIVSEYVSDANNTQALGGDTRFTAIAKLIGLMVDDGFNPDTCIIEVNDFVQAVTEQAGMAGPLPWLTAMQAGVSLGESFATTLGRMNGLVGTLFGNIPVYVVGNHSTLSGDIVLVEKMKAEVFGLFKDLTLKDNIDTMKDLREFKISATYDIALANNNAIGKVTGA